METDECTYCRKTFKSMPFSCEFCGFLFCVNHYMPEDHECVGLSKYKEKQIESLRKGKPERPVEYFHERWRRPQFRIFYYAILLAVTMLATFIVAGILG